MNVYGKKDESYEESRYPDWTLPEKKETLLPLFSILIGSLIATVISVVLPFIFNLMSPEQTQDLYIGWALHQTGQIYTDYFGTNGLLYYLVAYLLKGSVLISLVEWLALFGAGIFLFKAADTLTDQSEQAKQVVFVFYLLVAGLGFGGGYALFLALPFLFYSLHIVTQYLSYPDSDKGFLRLGMSFALAFFLAPLPTALFVVTIALALLGFNVAEHRFVHGLYQFFAAALGFSLVFYPLGYFTVLQGSFGDAISQTFYPLNAVSLFANNLLVENAVFYGLLAIGVGSLTLLFKGLFQLKPAKQYSLSLVASLGLLLVLSMLILSKESAYGSRLVLLIPFLILLLITEIKGKDRVNRRRRNDGDGSFLKSNLYLPLVAIAYLLLLPVLSRYVFHPSAYQERARLASVVKKETNVEDRVYAWDNRPEFYLESERLAPSSLLNPTLYTASDENKTKLMNDLKENQPKMIMVNQQVALWSDVETLLSEKYELVKTDTNEFKLYKLK